MHWTVWCCIHTIFLLGSVAKWMANASTAPSQDLIKSRQSSILSHPASALMRSANAKYTAEKICKYESSRNCDDKHLNHIPFRIIRKHHDATIINWSNSEYVNDFVHTVQRSRVDCTNENTTTTTTNGERAGMKINWFARWCAKLFASHTQISAVF